MRHGIHTPFLRRAAPKCTFCHCYHLISNIKYSRCWLLFLICLHRSRDTERKNTEIYGVPLSFFRSPRRCTGGGGGQTFEHESGQEVTSGPVHVIVDAVIRMTSARVRRGSTADSRRRRRRRQRLRSITGGGPHPVRLDGVACVRACSVLGVVRLFASRHRVSPARRRASGDIKDHRSRPLRK